MAHEQDNLVAKAAKANTAINANRW